MYKGKKLNLIRCGMCKGRSNRNGRRGKENRKEPV